MHQKLKEYFEKKGVSQQEIADSLGVSYPYVNAILNGKKPLGKKNAERLANLYGLSKSFLLTGEGEIECSAVHPQKSGLNETTHEQMPTYDISFMIEKMIANATSEKDKQLADKDKIITTQDELIATLKARIADLERTIAAHNMNDMEKYPFTIGAAEVERKRESV